MRRIVLLLLCFTITSISFGLLSKNSSAYVFSRNSSGDPLRWPEPVKPSFEANWNNASLLSYNQIFTSFTNSLQRWKNIGTAHVNFSYFQGGSSPAQVNLDGVNAVFFSSQASASQKLGASTLGVSYVFSSAGTIFEADVEFNDENFNFTTNPTHSSQFGIGSNVFLENVATHEFGHVYGLNHSAVLQSSMVYLEHRAQAKPSCDDIQGISEAYPAAGFSAARGALSGSVQVTGGTAIHGAQVLAISKTRGTVVSGALSNRDGTFTLSNLEPGDYYLMIEPFETTSPLSSLCGGVSSGCYYGRVNSATVCGGVLPFKRTFIESSPGVARKFSVRAGIEATTGVHTVSCSAMSDPWGAPVLSVGAAPTILSDNANAAADSGTWGVLGAVGSSQYFKLKNVEGNISVHVLSYGLYSPADVTVSLLASSGTTEAIGAVKFNNVFSNSSNYINYDAAVKLDGATGGDYYIRVTNRADISSSPNLYPAGAVGYGGVDPQISTVPYYLVLVSVNDPTLLLPSSANPSIANNARCESTDEFTAYPDTGPGPASTSSGVDSGAGKATENAGFSTGCGVLQRSWEKDQQLSRVVENGLFSLWGVLCFLFLGRGFIRLATRMNAR